MNRGKRTLRIFLSNLFSAVFILLYGKKLGSSGNDLLIVNTEKLGDLVLSADFLDAFRKKKGYGSYYLLISKDYVNLFNPEKSGYNIIPIHKAKYKFNLIYKLNFINQIRKKAFRTVINISPERGMINEELVLTSGASEKIALKDTSIYLSKSNLKKNNSRYDFIFKSGELNEYKRLMQYAGDDYERSNILSVKFNSDYQFQEDYIVIAPMASEMDRTWGLNNYRELLKKIKKRVILLGSESEKEILEQLEVGKSNVLNLAGKVTLSEAAGIINNAEIFIGNDSGLTHIAHYLGVPLLGIIGGGKHNIFFPYKERENAIFLFNKLDCFGCNWFCIYDRMKCFDVPVEQVLHFLEGLHENR